MADFNLNHMSNFHLAKHEFLNSAIEYAEYLDNYLVEAKEANDKEEVKTAQTCISFFKRSLEEAVEIVNLMVEYRFGGTRDD